MEERLQKILARYGYGSRRTSEVLIEKGDVTVNGKIATLGMKANPDVDKITVKGMLLPSQKPELVYIALHKPRFVLSDVNSDDDRKSVLDLVPKHGHLFAVGRLDLDSEGLILLTNDGELANRLTHPRYEHDKEYKVLVASRPDEQQLATWRRGVVLPEDGYKTAPAKVKVTGVSGKGAWLQIIMHEGKKRQIREIGSLLGLPVVKIIRQRIGTLELGNLKTGEYRYLKSGEVEQLYALSGLKKR